MPCYTIRTMTFELKGADQDVLVRGLRAAGFRVEISGATIYAYTKQGVQSRIANGKIEVQQGYEHVASLINRSYASEAVRTAASKFGYKVKQDTRDAQRVRLYRGAY